MLISTYFIIFSLVCLLPNDFCLKDSIRLFCSSKPKEQNKENNQRPLKIHTTISTGPHNRGYRRIGNSVHEKRPERYLYLTLPQMCILHSKWIVSNLLFSSFVFVSAMHGGSVEEGGHLIWLMIQFMCMFAFKAVAIFCRFSLFLCELVYIIISNNI